MTQTDTTDTTDITGITAVEGSHRSNGAETVTRTPERDRRPIRVVGPLAVFAAFIGMWYFVSWVVLPEYKEFLLPVPHHVLSSVFTDWDKMSPILSALWLTTQVAVIGFFISVVLGLTIGIVMSLADWIEWSLWPYAIALQCIPILALTPLIGGLLGFSFSARVVVTVMISLFPILSNTLFGILGTDRLSMDLFRLNHCSRARTLWKLQLPGAMPSIFAGCRISAGLAVIGAVVGDTFFRQGEPGIGALIDVYRLRLQGEEMMACIILAALLGLVVFVVVGTVNRRSIGHWHESTRTQ